MKNIFSSFRSTTDKPLTVGSEASAALSSKSETQKPGSLTVVELFQSQGCSSCPPANTNVMKLTEDPNLLVLSYGVTYWDHLGWKDTFGNPSFDQRQREYALTLNHRGLFTPQVIVNGRFDGVCNDPRELKSLIMEGAQKPTNNLSVTPLKDSVTLAGDDNQQGIVLMVRFDPRVHDVYVARGENEGRHLAHKNSVCDVTILGDYHGGTQVFSLSELPKDGLEAAILVQKGSGGSIIGAARLSV